MLIALGFLDYRQTNHSSSLCAPPNYPSALPPTGLANDYRGDQPWLTRRYLRRPANKSIILLGFSMIERLSLSLQTSETIFFHCPILSGSSHSRTSPLPLSACGLALTSCQPLPLVVAHYRSRHFSRPDPGKASIGIIRPAAVGVRGIVKADK